MKGSNCLAAALGVLLATGPTPVSAADRILTLASRQSNHAFSLLADGKVETQIALGTGAIFGIRDKTIHVLSATKVDGKVVRSLQTFESHTGKTLKKIEIEVPYLSWLGGPDEQLVVGDAGQYFLISVEDLGEAQGHKKKFSLAIINGDTGKAELHLLPEGFNSPRVQKIQGTIAIYGWTSSGLYCYDLASKSLTCVVPPGRGPTAKTYAAQAKYGMATTSESAILRWNTKGQVEQFDLKEGKMTPGRTMDLGVHPIWVIASTFNGTPALICGIKSSKEEMSLVAYDASQGRELARKDVPFSTGRAPTAPANGRALLVNEVDGQVWSMSLTDLSVREVAKLPLEIAPYPAEVRVLHVDE